MVDHIFALEQISSKTLIALHPISSKKLNYKDSHYLELSKLTIKSSKTDINKFAKKNLNLIGAMYQNE